MARAEPTLIDRRRARTSAAILGAAQAFRREGYHGTTIERIADGIRWA